MKVIAFVFVIATTLVLAAGQLNTVHEWNYIDYLWPNESIKMNAFESGRYIFDRVVPMDVDVDKDGRIFLSFLGAEGVPATLGTVSSVVVDSGPLIQPYPDWSWFDPDNCNTIQNVYRIAIDECNRLWVLDTGFLEGKPMKCQAKLLLFDLTNDQHLGTIIIPDKIAKNKDGVTLLANPVVETDGLNCKKTTVYVADTLGNSLVIVDLGSNKNLMWRLDNPAFGPDPNAANFVSGNDTATFMGGVLGLAVSPKIFPNEGRLLYFRSLASWGLSAMSTESLKQTIYGHSVKFETRNDILPSQAIAMAFSSQGTLFFGITGRDAIGCWNRYRLLSRDVLKTIAEDHEQLQYLNGVKVIRPSSTHPAEELWVLSNRFLGYVQGTLNPRNSNFRIMKAPVQDLVNNTVCDMPSNLKAKLPR
ncbi:major royal jelly protein 1-like [Copidosoma floridanum]|uniref:major royal jelly protein 1-like n=1 Tax=Copidosoma floridanum TaxID=29053 RepID=UPI0006C9D19C|nr:major royal jelly protein 1-like [Copidosoma floridanum]